VGSCGLDAGGQQFDLIRVQNPTNHNDTIAGKSLNSGVIDHGHFSNV
jgi:hypothetical protein